MKLLAVISFLFSSLILRAQILPDSFIRPNNIYEVTTVKTFLIKSSSGDSRQKINQTVIYNKQGYPVKFTETTHFNDGTGKDNFITTYFYEDTLLKRMESKASARGIVSKSFEARDYTFDELHRRTSLLTIDENKRQYKEKYVYNTLNLVDTVFHYSNDLSMYDLQQDRDKADSFHRKNLQLNSITVNSWDSAGRLLTTKEYYMQCRWKYLTEPDVCSATTVYTYSHDTLIQTLHSYMGEWQTLVSKHYSLPSGAVYEESQRGDKSVSFYLKNNKGLPKRMEKYEITAEGNMKQLVDTYQYKFNQ